MRHNQWRVAQAWTTQEQKKIQLREAILHHIGILPSHLEKEHKKKGGKKKKKKEKNLLKARAKSSTESLMPMDSMMPPSAGA